jgi:hypothetical protein
MYTNTRRAATSHLPTSRATPTSPTTGSDKRKALRNDLSPLDKKHLDMFKLADGRTETDVYMVYACSLDYKSGRICLETDTPPRLVVQDVIGLDLIKSAPSNSVWFFLPAIVLDNPTWRETFPKFERWALSSCRYPLVDESTKTVQPHVNAPSGVREVSELDTLEMYFAALFATLSEFYSTGDPKYAENSWKLMWTLNTLLRRSIPSGEPNVVDLLTQTEKFKALILNRDRTVSDAVEYRKFVNSLKPAHYYWMLYQLMLECPEVVHKSHLSNLDTFILGLMTQPALTNIGCTLTGIEDSLLRMILERSMKWIGKQNLADFVETEPMIEHLHTTAGRSVESALRYWSFMVETIRSVLLVRPFTRNEFVAQVQVIRTNMHLLQGITPFCLSICPDADKYLNDAVLAEFILAASQADKKFTVLATKILSSKTETPLLTEILTKNVERVRKLQAELKAPTITVSVIPAADSSSASSASSASSVSSASSASSASTTEPPVTGWNDFLTEISWTAQRANEIHSAGRYDAYKRYIIKLAYRGDEFSRRCLQQLLIEGYKVNPPLLGERRALALVLRATRAGSAVDQHYSQLVKPNDLKHIRNTVPSGPVGLMLRDINRDLSRVATAVRTRAHSKGNKHSDEPVEERPSNFDDAPIAFVKFELAREMIREVRQKMTTEMAGILHECFICFEEVAANKMIALHGDPRHSICVTCRGPLTTCPFCRAVL